MEALVRIAGEERRDYLPVYNVGNPDERTVLEIAVAIGRAAKGHGVLGETDLAFLPADKDDPRQRCPDTSRIQGALGWAPVVPLAEGLRRTVEWFRGRA